MIKHIFTLLFVICVARVDAQNTETVAPFNDGEKLTFTISYKFGFINSDVADVFFNTTIDKDSSTNRYKVHAYSQTYPFVKAFFNINDQYYSYLDAQTLRPTILQTELSEGKYRFSSRYDYDWKNNTVKTHARNHSKPEPRNYTLTLKPDSFDGLSFFYNLRSRDLANYTPNQENTVNLVLEDTIRPIKYKFIGREVKNIKGLGKFRTLKFTCQLATSEGETFDDGSELTIWISDDQNKIPLHIESPIKVGKIRARLTNFEELKYPLSSKVE